MNFKTNKIILFCNRRITPQIAQNWGKSEYVKSLLETVLVQAENEQLSEIDFKNLINYVIYNLGSYYRGNVIFVFQLLVAFLYLITPVDIVSDFIPAIGYIDDLMLLKLILDTYSSELETFNKVKRDMLDIKYMRVDSKIIDDFQIKPHEAVDLIIKDKKLEEVNGEQLINQLIAEKDDQYDLINIDIVEILSYELINYLLKSKTGEELISEELMLSLIQIPDIIEKKDVTYFLKNLVDIFDYQPIEISIEKKGIFATNSRILKFNVEELISTTQIDFVQTDADYNSDRKFVIKYASRSKARVDYITIVEMIDLINQKHIFADTTLYFELSVDAGIITFKIDKLNKKVEFMTSIKIANSISAELYSICKIINERMI